MTMIQFIVQQLKNAGVDIKEEKNPLKLHATLIKTIFENGKRDTYDVTDIFDKLGNYDFGEVPLKKISLCVMGTKNPDTGYQSLVNIPLPYNKMEKNNNI